MSYSMTTTKHEEDTKSYLKLKKKITKNNE